MDVVVAMDSFKGSLDAASACAAVARGLERGWPELQVLVKPLADGGEGTAAALLRARGGDWQAMRVRGPLPEMEVEAGYARFPNGEALVEMAVASGLPLLKPEDYNPLRTTTYGTGQLIRAAAEEGPVRLLLAVGGSATVDGGTGAAAALGWSFRDEWDRPLQPCGEMLRRCRRLVPPAHPPILPPVRVLCDVQNPLLGPNGAARVYGPQKGATPKMVEELEEGLARLAELAREQLGKEIDVPGAGAAGGLAAGALAFMDAELIPGIETIMKVMELPEALRNAAWVVTGEGSFDLQSLSGKVVAGVIRVARKRSARVAVIAGRVALSPEDCRRHGIEKIFAIRTPDMPLEYAMSHAAELLEQAGCQLAQELGAA